LIVAESVSSQSFTNQSLLQQKVIVSLAVKTLLLAHKIITMVTLFLCSNLYCFTYCYPI